MFLDQEEVARVIARPLIIPNSKRARPFIIPNSKRYQLHRAPICVDQLEMIDDISITISCSIITNEY